MARHFTAVVLALIAFAVSSNGKIMKEKPVKSISSQNGAKKERVIPHYYSAPHYQTYNDDFNFVEPSIPYYHYYNFPYNYNYYNDDNFEDDFEDDYAWPGDDFRQWDDFNAPSMVPTAAPTYGETSYSFVVNQLVEGLEATTFMSTSTYSDSFLHSVSMATLLSTDKVIITSVSDVSDESSSRRLSLHAGKSNYNIEVMYEVQFNLADVQMDDAAVAYSYLVNRLNNSINYGSFDYWCRHNSYDADFRGVHSKSMTFSDLVGNDITDDTVSSDGNALSTATMVMYVCIGVGAFAVFIGILAFLSYFMYGKVFFVSSDGIWKSRLTAKRPADQNLQATTAGAAAPGSGSGRVDIELSDVSTLYVDIASDHVLEFTHPATSHRNSIREATTTSAMIIGETGNMV